MSMRSAFRAIALVASSSLMTAACGAEADLTESSNSAFTQVDQEGIDVQALQIWTPEGRVFPTVLRPIDVPKPSDIQLDALKNTGCKKTRDLPAVTGWTSQERNCASALGAAAPFDVTKEVGPVFTPVVFRLDQRLPDGAVFADPDFCNRVEVRIVARNASVEAPSFSGIGFHTSKGDSFTKKADLQSVGKTTLKNGDAATVYRFTGISTCISSAHNSTSGNMFQTFEFKPYAAFDEKQSGTTIRRYRVWERVGGNHSVGRSGPSAPQVTSFDRAGDLLRP